MAKTTLPKSDFQLTSKEVSALKTFHRTLRDKRFAYRVNTIILFGTGRSVSEVAEVLLIDETTVYNWLEKYQHGGKDVLLSLCYKGKPCSFIENSKKTL